jgi:hypothetical protein
MLKKIMSWVVSLTEVEPSIMKWLESAERIVAKIAYFVERIWDIIKDWIWIVNDQ